jgi:phosphohistidine phosphatase
MKVYLIQHAQSKSKEEDPDRSLTDEGRRAIERVAAHCAKINITMDRIYHSGKLRAQQTAEILAMHLSTIDRVRAQKGLDPLDDVQPTRRWLEEQVEEGLRSVAIVGHLPFLDKLASLLVAGNEAAGVVAFQYAGIVTLAPKTYG